MTLNCRIFSTLMLLFLCSCSQRAGYEALQQMQYQSCVQASPKPVEDCQDLPDYEEYRKDLKIMYPANVEESSR